METLKEIYGTDSVEDLLDEWRTRLLGTFYPVVFFDTLVINVKDNTHIVRKSIFLALGINQDGAKFWFDFFNELKNRGVQDFVISVLMVLPDSTRR